LSRNIETPRPRPPEITQATSSLAPGGPLTRARKRGKGKGKGKGKDSGRVKRVAKLSGGQSKAATPARGGSGFSTSTQRYNLKPQNLDLYGIGLNNPHSSWRQGFRTAEAHGREKAAAATAAAAAPTKMPGAEGRP
jgi:hypothetical protein